MKIYQYSITRVLTLLIISGFISLSQAGSLPAGLQGKISFKVEDDRNDDDDSNNKFKIEFKKTIKFDNEKNITLGASFEDESYDQFFEGTKERDYMIFARLQVFKNEYIAFAPELSFEWKDKRNKDNDHLLIPGMTIKLNLPASLKLNFNIKAEDDQHDSDETLYKTKAKLAHNIKFANGMKLKPYIWLEDESYNGAVKERKESETGIGVDWSLYKHTHAEAIFGLSYEYEDNASGDDDKLINSTLSFKF